MLAKVQVLLAKAQVLLAKAQVLLAKAQVLLIKAQFCLLTLITSFNLTDFCLVVAIIWKMLSHTQTLFRSICICRRKTGPRSEPQDCWSLWGWQDKTKSANKLTKQITTTTKQTRHGPKARWEGTRKRAYCWSDWPLSSHWPLVFVSSSYSL